jgi:hypothetical protein
MAQIDQVGNIDTGIFINPNTFTRQLSRSYEIMGSRINLLSDIFTTGQRAPVKEQDSRWSWQIGSGFPVNGPINDSANGLDGTTIYAYAGADYLLKSHVNGIFLRANPNNPTQYRPSTIYEALLGVIEYVNAQIANRYIAIVSSTATESVGTGDITFNNIQIIGAGVASGDEEGRGTIELVPDASLYTNDQYLIIDPTVPDHIHIRAGGTQDDSNGVLILGGETSNVTIADKYSNHVTIKSANVALDNYYDWQFNNNGSTGFPVIPVDLLTGGPTAVEALKFSNNSLYSVITGPTPATEDDVKPLIIQGQSQVGAVGGDVCLWAGDSNNDAGNINIKAGNTSGSSGLYGGYIVLQAGSNANSIGSDITFYAGAGANAAQAGKLLFNSGNYNWRFKPDGSTTLPVQSVSLHTGGVTPVEALKFGDNTKSSVITGATPEASTAAKALILQGHNQTGAAGGDVYLWGGDSTTAGGNIEILAGDNDASTGSAGLVTIKGGAFSSGTGGNVAITGGTGTTHGEVTIASNSFNWTFSNAGTTTFPRITTNLLGVSTSVEGLRFGDNTKSSVITGPTPAASQPVKEIIVQGQDQTGAAGGDVCLYGGKSNRNAGDINITAGTSTGGAPYSAGAVTLQAGSNTTGTGGNVSILGGTGSTHGEVTITSNSNTWTFNNDGNMTIPVNKDILDSAGNSATDGGNRRLSYNSADGVNVPVGNYNIFLITTTGVGASVTTVELPDSKEVPIGYTFTVMDYTGGASIRKITILPQSDDNIISITSGGIIIDTNYGLVTLKNVGAGWAILYGR